MSLALSETEWQAHLAAREQPDHKDIRIDRVVVGDSRTRSSRHIARTISRIEPGSLSIDQLEDVLDQTMSEGGYERVAYHLKQQGDESILGIEPVDRSWGPGLSALWLRLG